MHSLLRYIAFGCLPFLAGMIGINPVYWFFALYLISHPTLKCLGLALLGTAIGTASLQVAGMYCSRIRSGAELRRDERLRDGDLTPVIIESLKGVIPDELWTDIASARVESSPLWHRTPNAQGNEVYIFVSRPRTLDAPWTPGSAFLGSVGQRVAILRDDPLKAVRPWPRFLFIHELAHVSSEGVGLQVARWRYLLTTLHALITVFVLSAPLEHRWITALLLLGAALSFHSFLLFERLCESYADASAFRVLTTPDERSRVLDLVRHEADGASKKFGEKHFHTRLWRDRLVSLNNSRRFSPHSQKGGGTTFDPSMFPFLLASMAAGILAWYSQAASPRQFWIYAIWCASCQLGAVILQIWAKHTDANVRIALHKRIKGAAKSEKDEQTSGTIRPSGPNDTAPR